MIDKLLNLEDLKIQLIKEGLEDLNLYVMEIDSIHNKLENEKLNHKEKNLLIYKLITLESKILNMSESVKENLKPQINDELIS
jgi:hypothetical protein